MMWKRVDGARDVGDPMQKVSLVSPTLRLLLFSMLLSACFPSPKSNIEIIVNSLTVTPQTCKKEVLSQAVAPHLSEFSAHMPRDEVLLGLKKIALSLNAQRDENMLTGCIYALQARYPVLGTSGTIFLVADFTAEFRMEDICVNYFDKENGGEDNILFSQYPWRDVPTGNKYIPSTRRFNAPCFGEKSAINYYSGVL